MSLTGCIYKSTAVGPVNDPKGEYGIASGKEYSDTELQHDIRFRTKKIFYMLPDFAFLLSSHLHTALFCQAGRLCEPATLHRQCMVFFVQSHVFSIKYKQEADGFTDRSVEEIVFSYEGKSLLILRAGKFLHAPLSRERAFQQGPG
jgi:hypothetical protein